MLWGPNCPTLTVPMELARMGHRLDAAGNSATNVQGARTIDG